MHLPLRSATLGLYRDLLRVASQFDDCVLRWYVTRETKKLFRRRRHEKRIGWLGQYAREGLACIHTLKEAAHTWHQGPANLYDPTSLRSLQNVIRLSYGEFGPLQHELNKVDTG